MVMVVHGESISLENADGWFASEDEIIIGLITYRIVNSEMEILSLDSLRKKNGIGTALINKVIEMVFQNQQKVVWRNHKLWRYQVEIFVTPFLCGKELV